jgi:hypothetical protein
LNNLASGSDIEILLELDKKHFVDHYANMLKDNDTQVIVYSLEGLKILFGQGEILKSSFQFNPFVKRFSELNGHALIERYQKSKSKEIYSLSLQILDIYFSDDHIIDS